MIFNGDLSKYHPADAIMFLSQLNLNGVFSVVADRRPISLCFRNGVLIDAHSSRSDAKIMRTLIFHRRLGADQVQHIRRIQAETGMPIRAILAELRLFPLSSIEEILLVGMRDVLLEMFLLQSGSFHFTDALVEADDADIRLDAASISLSIAAQSDEFRDFEKRVVSLEREISLAAALPADGAADKETVILRLVPSCRTIRQLLDTAPFDRFAVMEILRAQLDAGTVVLHAPTAEAVPAEPEQSIDPLFGAFRQAMKTLMLTAEPLKQLEALVAYCKGFYDGMLILTAREGQLVHCKKIHRRGRTFAQHDTKGSLGALADDVVFAAVQRSGVAFFGGRFPSPLLDGLCGGAAVDECALVPVAVQGPLSLFLFVFNGRKFSGLSPQHYLELLSWMTAARKRSETAPAASAAGRSGAGSDGQPPGARQLAPARMVATIDDLPPLPVLIARALDLLGDPDAKVAEIAAVIGKDQSLVSKLIRVSNSALYGGRQRAESLQQAMTRLGTRTTRSLIVAASMQNYFLKCGPGLQTWGQALWQHAAECGMAARRIAAAVGDDDPETAFVGGVVHDIGKLVILLHDGEAYRGIQNLMRRENLSSTAAEMRVVGTDHIAVGVQLMDKWKMPASARWCVRYHHHSEDAGEGRRLATITAYANQLSHRFGQQDPSTDADAEIGTLAERLNLDAVRQRALAGQVAADFHSAGLF